jgi:S1-C subfamily serine protease
MRLGRYILTNRHVVGSGPFWGYCIFDNHEEVDAYPVYRDPVHDFGILRFDPKAIKYMSIDALQLRPDLAKGILQSWRADTSGIRAKEGLTVWHSRRRN